MPRTLPTRPRVQRTRQFNTIALRRLGSEGESEKGKSRVLPKFHPKRFATSHRICIRTTEPHHFPPKAARGPPRFQRHATSRRHRNPIPVGVRPIWATPRHSWVQVEREGRDALIGSSRPFLFPSIDSVVWLTFAAGAQNAGELL